MPVNKCCRSVEEQDVRGGGAVRSHRGTRRRGSIRCADSSKKESERDWFNSGSVLQFRLKLVPFVQMKNVSKLLYFVQIHV
jgi:hypothetical protein